MKRTILIAVALAGATAHADDAFPDELQVFAPADQPDVLVVATNFGLVETTDRGAHWGLVCEAAVSGTRTTQQYQRGPQGTLYGLTAATVSRSTDQGCTWTGAGVDPANVRTARDFFPDPTRGSGRVAALSVGGPSGARGAYYLSTDDGATFAPVVSDVDADLVGVEFSASQPGSLWLTGARYPPDAGARLPFVRFATSPTGPFTEHLHAELAGAFPFLAQVDPADATVAYLRLLDPAANDKLARCDQAGATCTVLLALGDELSAFVKASDGTLYAGTRNNLLYRQRPGEATFTALPGPAIRCLGERAGVLYACGDDALDGFALGASTDHGEHFVPVLRFEDIQGPLQCVEATCATFFRNFRSQFPVDAGPAQPDAGPPDAGAPDAGPGPVSKPGGCGCGDVDLGLAGLFAAAARVARKRRQR
jgi:hypothetical protein